MREPFKITVTKVGPEGPGCYSCRLSRTCILYQTFQRKFMVENGQFFDVDNSRDWQGIVATLGQACRFWDPYPEPGSQGPTG